MPFDESKHTNLTRKKYETRPFETYIRDEKWSLNLLESHIRYAMANTTNNTAAARFLKVNSHTYRKYAKKYIDSATGKSLYDLHTNPNDPNRTKVAKRQLDIISELGKRTKYIPLWRIRKKLFNSGAVEEKCQCCGYAEKRLIDGKVPLQIHFRNPKAEFPYELQNLHILCFNCSYQIYGSEIFMRMIRTKFDMDDGLIK